MLKPDTCKGCPLYNDGKGFVPDEPATNPEVFVILQNPGEDEEHEAKPAIGKTGRFLDTSFIPLTGLQRGKTLQVGNALRCRWRDPIKKRKTNDLPDKKDILDQALKHCEQYLAIPDSVKVVVAAGDPASRYYGRLDKADQVNQYTGKWERATVTDWRGFFAPDKYKNRPVYTVLHPAALFHNPLRS